MDRVREIACQFAGASAAAVGPHASQAPLSSPDPLFSHVSDPRLAFPRTPMHFQSISSSPCSGGGTGACCSCLGQQVASLVNHVELLSRTVAGMEVRGKTHGDTLDAIRTEVRGIATTLCDVAARVEVIEQHQRALISSNSDLLEAIRTLLPTRVCPATRSKGTSGLRHRVTSSAWHQRSPSSSAPAPLPPLAPISSSASLPPLPPPPPPSSTLLGPPLSQSSELYPSSASPPSTPTHDHPIFPLQPASLASPRVPPPLSCSNPSPLASPGATPSSPLDDLPAFPTSPATPPVPNGPSSPSLPASAFQALGCSPVGGGQPAVSLPLSLPSPPLPPLPAVVISAAPASTTAYVSPASAPPALPPPELQPPSTSHVVAILDAGEPAAPAALLLTPPTPPSSANAVLAGEASPTGPPSILPPRPAPPPTSTSSCFSVSAAALSLGRASTWSAGVPSALLAAEVPATAASTSSATPPMVADGWPLPQPDAGGASGTSGSSPINGAARIGIGTAASPPSSSPPPTPPPPPPLATSSDALLTDIATCGIAAGGSVSGGTCQASALMEQSPGVNSQESLSLFQNGEPAGGAASPQEGVAASVGAVAVMTLSMSASLLKSIAPPEATASAAGLPVEIRTASADLTSAAVPVMPLPPADLSLPPDDTDGVGRVAAASDGAAIHTAPTVSAAGSGQGDAGDETVGADFTTAAPPSSQPRLDDDAALGDYPSITSVASAQIALPTSAASCQPAQPHHPLHAGVSDTYLPAFRPPPPISAPATSTSTLPVAGDAPSAPPSCPATPAGDGAEAMSMEMPTKLVRAASASANLSRDSGASSSESNSEDGSARTGAAPSARSGSLTASIQRSHMADLFWSLSPKAAATISRSQRFLPAPAVAEARAAAALRRRSSPAEAVTAVGGKGPMPMACVGAGAITCPLLSAAAEDCSSPVDVSSSAQSLHGDVPDAPAAMTTVTTAAPAIAPDEATLCPMANADPAALLRTRAHIFDELVTTERSYVEKLAFLVRRVVEPLQRVLRRDECRLLGLADLRIISAVNTQMLQELGAGPESVGRVMQTMCHFLKTYSAYVANYMETLKYMRMLTSSNRAVKKIIKAAERDKEAGGQTLDSFMILPVQRVPRYQLLFAELLKNTPLEHPERASLVATYREIRQVARVVNERARENENLLKCLDIATQLGQLNKDFLAPARRFQREAVFLLGNVSFVKVLLFTDLIVFALPHRDKSGTSLEVFAQWPLAMVTASRLFSSTIGPVDFQVTHTMEGNSPFRLTAPTQAAADAWVEAITELGARERALVQRVASAVFPQTKR